MLRVSSLLGLVALAPSCGARSELVVADASPGTSPVPLACKVPAVGGIVWQTSFPTDQRWTGPWAADDEGATYYLGEDLGGVTASRYSILAIDACGKVKWRSEARPTASFDGAQLGVVVTGDRVLFQSGIIDALDRATGALL